MSIYTKINIVAGLKMHCLQIPCAAMGYVVVVNIIDGWYKSFYFSRMISLPKTYNVALGSCFVISRVEYVFEMQELSWVALARQCRANSLQCQKQAC